MKKKILFEELINNGFNKDEHNNFSKTFENILVYVRPYSNLFGSVTMLGIFYKYKSILEEKYHDEVWKKCVDLIDQDQQLKIGSLGFDYMEADILDKKFLDKIDINLIEYYCNYFANK
ncbi:MAG: hypothetical protein IJW82_06150 [Clostridia bacterium]|nr:hypothetical protein [Clostridia bacterium]